MNLSRQTVRLKSLGDPIAGTLYVPDSDQPVPALIVCHGAGEFKENYAPMCERLAQHGLATLALDMHGHGESGGERFHVKMSQWVADIEAALEFLLARSEVDKERIGAFGLSSGGTAVLEAGVVESRLKALIALSATVRNPLSAMETAVIKSLLYVGKLKRRLTRRELRVPLARLSIGPKLASDPEVNRRLLSDPHSLEAFQHFPMPGAEEAFFVDTIHRVPRIQAPTLVLWGGDDKVDSPKTARLLSDALTCKKKVEIIPGNGHVGHLDRHRETVFALTAEWALQNLRNGHVAITPSITRSATRPQVIEGERARQMSRQEKWDLLSPFLKQSGGTSLAYATLQEGMEYFVDECGYIAYTTVRHPVFSPRPRRITLADPVCAPADWRRLVTRFLADNPRVTFGVVTEPFAEFVRPLGFKVNCLGYEPELPLQTYNTQGNWKALDLIKRARNEVKREHLTIREEEGASLNAEALSRVSARWIGTKKINDREIWLYARRPIFDREEDVRKFVAYDRDGEAVGFVFYDPMYRQGKVYGYSANISRCDEARFGRLATAVHMVAADKFREEGKEVLNLLLAPFQKMELGKYNDDLSAQLLFRLSARFGNDIYNFKGLSFHKSKYRGIERPLYCASNSLMMSNDLYMAFVSADITHSYFSILGQIVRGMFAANTKGKSA